jgi:CPA2 family monovalent cation:H+ antiporter-2
LVFGLALSVASTVVLLRALEERVAVGWLIVEDLELVVALVLLPARAGALSGVSRIGESDVLAALAVTLGKAALFRRGHGRGRLASNPVAGTADF